jgi:HSP20 family protein
MVDLVLKPGTTRLNRVFIEETRSLAPDGVRWRMATRPMVWRPPTDVYETEGAVIIRVEIAGMREEDFTISLEDRIVTIHGTRIDVAERRAYYQMEIPFGEFSTIIELPCAILADKTSAVYQDGLLRVMLPKASPYQIRADQ